jgi:lipid-A-disaccharide synthase-like uncharacterized protein
MKVQTFWLLVGFTGQFLFTSRFLVQWLVSEQRRKSVVPHTFWWLSLLGGSCLLIYACYQRDPVIILGQSLGIPIYLRNLMLIGHSNNQSQWKEERTQRVLFVTKESEKESLAA